jgi:hypothetical protein
MSIVGNASPLINLAPIGKFNLLHKLYGELIVPEAVLWKEPGTQEQMRCGKDKSGTGKATVYRPMAGFPGYRGNTDGGTMGPIACP